MKKIVRGDVADGLKKKVKKLEKENEKLRSILKDFIRGWLHEDPNYVQSVYEGAHKALGLKVPEEEEEEEE